MQIILNKCTDPYFNLALEEHLLCGTDGEYFLLWQNAPSVIVGRNQNTYAEINYDFVKSNNIPVVRRITGGGAVFHDLGNINYSFIVNSTSRFNDYAFFSAPVIRALSDTGIDACLSGRNDLLVNGKKISGAAQCAKGGRMLHHATLLLDASVSDLKEALRINPLKIESKGIKSVESRVANVNSFLENKLTAQALTALLAERISEDFQAQVCEISAADIAAARQLADEKYSKDEWNFGSKKDFSVSKQTKLDCGLFDVRLNIEKGEIRDARIFGDFFTLCEISSLEAALSGVRYTPEALSDFVDSVNLNRYFYNLSKNEFLSLFI